MRQSQINPVKSTTKYKKYTFGGIMSNVAIGLDWAHKLAVDWGYNNDLQIVILRDKYCQEGFNMELLI